MPLAIDLFCGLGGWAEGLLAEGWDVVGFDIERHAYGEECYPGQLVIQDVLTLHGSQFASADLIVASPPCQFFSYTAMPWSRSRELADEVRADPERLARELALFNACFRLQREASKGGRRVPLVVENVRGAQRWVGRSAWNFGAFHFWGDVPALMPIPSGGLQFKSNGMNWSDRSLRGQDFTRLAGRRDAEGIKQGGGWWHDPLSLSQTSSSKSPARKRGAALIAKIPGPVARHIARTFRPATSRSTIRSLGIPSTGGTT